MMCLLILLAYQMSSQRRLVTSLTSWISSAASMPLLRCDWMIKQQHRSKTWIIEFFISCDMRIMLIGVRAEEEFRSALGSEHRSTWRHPKDEIDQHHKSEIENVGLHIMNWHDKKTLRKPLEARSWMRWTCTGLFKKRVLLKYGGSSICRLSVTFLFQSRTIFSLPNSEDEQMHKWFKTLTTYKIPQSNWVVSVQTVMRTQISCFHGWQHFVLELESS